LHTNWCQVRRAVVLQLDICSFTELSQSVSPMYLANVMHHLFSAFDTSVQSLDLFKMDTVGDAYIIAGWLSLPLMEDGSETSLTLQKHESQQLCQRVLLLAGSMQDILENHNAKSAHVISARIGIGVGNVVVGAFGSLQPRVHIRGDGMRVAEFLEQQASPGTIHVDDIFLDTLQSRGCDQGVDTSVVVEADVGGNSIETTGECPAHDFSSNFVNPPPGPWVVEGWYVVETKVHVKGTAREKMGTRCNDPDLSKNSVLRSFLIRRAK
jgi:class 3 adenylate cyclase